MAPQTFPVELTDWGCRSYALSAASCGRMERCTILRSTSHSARSVSMGDAGEICSTFIPKYSATLMIWSLMFSQMTIPIGRMPNIRLYHS